MRHRPPTRRPHKRLTFEQALLHLKEPFEQLIANASQTTLRLQADHAALVKGKSETEGKAAALKFQIDHSREKLMQAVQARHDAIALPLQASANSKLRSIAEQVDVFSKAIAQLSAGVQLKAALAERRFDRAFLTFTELSCSVTSADQLKSTVPGTADLQLSLHYQQLLTDIARLGQSDNQQPCISNIAGTLCSSLGIKDCFVDEAVIYTQPCFIPHSYDGPVVNCSKYHGFSTVLLTNYGSVYERVISNPQIVDYGRLRQVNINAVPRVHSKGQFELPPPHQALLVTATRNHIPQTTASRGAGAPPGVGVYDVGLTEDCVAVAIAKLAVQVVVGCGDTARRFVNLYPYNEGAAEAGVLIHMQCALAMYTTARRP